MGTKIPDLNLADALAGDDELVVEQSGATKRFLAGSIFRRNRIRNGDLSVAQRGDGPFTTVGQYSLDGIHEAGTGTTFSATRQTFVLGQTDVPGNPKYYYRNVVTSVAAASNYHAESFRIEGVETFAGETCTFSFYASEDAGDKDVAVEAVQNFGTGGTPSSTVTAISVTTVSLTSTFTRYDVQITFPSVSGKTLGTNGDDYIEVNIWMDAGSNFDARTNSLGQQSGSFNFALLQLEAGTVATPFERLPLAEQQNWCDRYLQAFGGANYSCFGTGHTASSSLAHIQVPYRTPFRVPPSVSVSGAHRLISGNEVTTNPSFGTSYIDKYSVLVVLSITTHTVGRGAQWQASNDPNARVYLSAEL